MVVQPLTYRHAATHDNYLWRETSIGVWQRDADDAEIFYSSLIKLFEGSGRMHFAITGRFLLTVDVPANATPEATAVHLEECLRTAWLHLRHEMLTIAAHPVGCRSAEVGKNVRDGPRRSCSGVMAR